MGLCVTDAGADPRYNAEIDGPCDSTLAVPLWDRGTEGNVLGVVSLRCASDTVSDMVTDSRTNWD